MAMVFVSCNDHYNETVRWIASIKEGTDLEQVRKSQPGFVMIDWDHPSDSTKQSVLYLIGIKNNPDVLGMSNGLFFSNRKYIGRYVHK